jgi:hypothetical protein
MKKIISYFKVAPKRMSESLSAKKYDIVLHIGAPKTGSSAIQKFLLENKKHLADNGFYYPEHGLDENGISGGHSVLGLSLVNGETQKSKEILQSYIADAKNNNMTLLLSAESFFNHHNKLAKLVEGYRCKVIAFFRDPLESLFSSYNQSIKRHFNTTHIAQVCKSVLLNKSYANSHVYAQWIDSFGKSNVTILEYNKQYFTKHPIQEVFLLNIGLDTKIINKIKPKNLEQINKSYSLAELEFKRVLNHVLDKDNKKENFEIDWQLQKISDKREETRTLIDELSSDLYDSLYKKLDEDRSKLIEYGMLCLQKPQNNETAHRQNKYLYKNKINDILKIVEYFKNEQADLYDYMRLKIPEYMQNKINISCDVLNLAEWFDIDIEMLSGRAETWFSQAQLTNMAAGQYKEADFLRDIATLLLHRGDVGNADKIVSKALELRPNGPGIIKLKETILKSKVTNAKH